MSCSGLHCGHPAFGHQLGTRNQLGNQGHAVSFISDEPTGSGEAALRFGSPLLPWPLRSHDCCRIPGQGMGVARASVLLTCPFAPRGPGEPWPPHPVWPASTPLCRPAEKAAEKRKEAPGCALVPPSKHTQTRLGGEPGWGTLLPADTYLLVSVKSFVGAGGSLLSMPPPLTWNMGVAGGSGTEVRQGVHNTLSAQAA